MVITENLNVTSFIINGINSLDSIRVFLEKTGPAQGRLIVECYGRAWSCYWGNMGMDVERFLINANIDYLEKAMNVGTPTKKERDYLKRIMIAVQEALGKIQSEPQFNMDRGKIWWGRHAQNLLPISKNLQEQDGRCTADPVFYVQELERIGPIMLEYIDDEAICFTDSEMNSVIYHDDGEEWNEYKKLHDDDELPDHIVASGYIEKWITVQTCFTEEGCNQYLAANKHNLSRHGVRTYVESFYRNIEMINVRDALMELNPKINPKPETFQP